MRTRTKSRVTNCRAEVLKEVVYYSYLGSTGSLALVPALANVGSYLLVMRFAPRSMTAADVIRSRQAVSDARELASNHASLAPSDLRRAATSVAVEALVEAARAAILQQRLWLRAVCSNPIVSASAL
jgi:hypothetical protein